MAAARNIVLVSLQVPVKKNQVTILSFAEMGFPGIGVVMALICELFITVALANVCIQ